MPKGHVDPREVTCRACSTPFVTTKVGKAAELCHGPECDRTRDVARRAQREAAAAQRARERAADTERKRLARAVQREADRLARMAEREAQRREAKVAKLLAELHELGWRPPVVTSERVVVETPTIGSGPVGEALRGLPRAVIARHASEDVGKGSLRRAIAAVAHAAGAHATADACRRLAVEALAWEFRLRHAAREVGEGAGPDATAAARKRERDAERRAELEAVRAVQGRPGDALEDAA